MKNCHQAIVVTALVAAILCTGLAPFVSGAAAQTPLLSVSPDSTIVADGTVFTLDFVVSAEVVDLMGFDIAVTFDSDVIELLSVNEGSLPLLSGYPTFFHWYGGSLATDSVHVNGAILGNTVDGPGVLFTLEFKGHAGTGIQETDVIIAHSVMRTGVNADIAHDVENGWVQVLLGVRTETTSWGYVKSLYAGDR